MRWLLNGKAVLALAGFAGLTLAAGGPASIADADLAAWVKQRVQERQPPAADRRFDEIGWARDIRHALELAKEHNRPVFLFTHDGRMNVGRC